MSLIPLPYEQPDSSVGSPSKSSPKASIEKTNPALNEASRLLQKFIDAPKKKLGDVKDLESALLRAVMSLQKEKRTLSLQKSKKTRKK
jgi:hypothetical protein